MNVVAKRLYISKLPDFLKKSDVESKFSHYGKVISVEIMHRKNGFQEDQPPFAYVNLETSDEELLRCIRDFANKKWKGEFVDVQIAKENFLSRLQREREEEKNKKHASNEWKKEQVFNNFAPVEREKEQVFSKFAGEEGSASNRDVNAATKRLYISKLPDFLKKSDVESKFSHYGNVVSVDIMHRRNGENEPAFAYVNLDTSEEELLRCIRDFSNKKWKGDFVDVQVAKESFLSRLQREREDEKKKKYVPDARENRQDFNNFAAEEFNSMNQKSRGKKFHLDEENESVGEEVKKEVKRKKIYFDEDGGNAKEEIINHSLVLNGSAKVENPVNIVKKDPKQIEADKKRQTSNIEMRNQFRQQKLHIRSALLNLDAKAPNKKIIFGENAIEKQVSTEKNNKQLFNDEDSEGDEDMNVPLKPQFDGKEGHKLFQLQSRFKNDKRFVMDEKFREDEIENAAEEAPRDEKEAQLCILEGVLGKKVATKPKEIGQKQPKAMLRYDPDDPQHKTYELQPQEEEKPSTKKKKRKEAPAESEEAKPEVSKSKFYKVSDDLKNVFQAENKGFSLLAAREDVELDDDDDVEMQEENQEIVKEVQKNKKNTVMDFEKAFNNVTSDEEEMEEEISSKAPKKEEDTSEKNKSAADRLRFWSEPFFFQNDDFRFQEGVDFIKRLGCQENGDFLELRRNLKEVVRSKVRHVQRKKGMFKKKLGGVKKRMKMKRALKR